MPRFTVVTDDGEHVVEAVRSGPSIRLAVGDLHAATEWDLKPEGLCRDDVCVPVRDRASILVDGTVDLQAFANVLRRPLAIDDEVDIAVLGGSVAERAADREGMRVPEGLTMQDLDGNVHPWSELGRRKKLLFAWASW
jgi:hypothetical protein